MDKKESKKLDSAEERGRRLHYIRTELLHISRNMFANKHPGLLSKSALQNWEDGRYGGLTEKGAKKLIQAFEKEHINCDLQWLLYGVGTPPIDLNNSNHFLLDLPDITVTQRPISTDEEAIEKELRFFKAIYGDTLDAIVTDNGLNPFLAIGDHVAGIRWTGKEIEQAIGQLCIIQTYEGLLLTRKVGASNKPGYYQLLCTNQEIQQSAEARLFSAAPIMWVRKPLQKSRVNRTAVATR